ncbi:hypothetical protein AOLI_G00143720 [Acnodon oligacanthus]
MPSFQLGIRSPQSLDIPLISTEQQSSGMFHIPAHRCHNTWSLTAAPSSLDAWRMEEATSLLSYIPLRACSEKENYYSLYIFIRVCALSFRPTKLTLFSDGTSRPLHFGAFSSLKKSYWNWAACMTLRWSRRRPSLRPAKALARRAVCHTKKAEAGPYTGPGPGRSLGERTERAKQRPNATIASLAESREGTSSRGVRTPKLPRGGDEA